MWGEKKSSGDLVKMGIDLINTCNLKNFGQHGKMKKIAFYDKILPPPPLL